MKGLLIYNGYLITNKFTQLNARLSDAFLKRGCILNCMGNDALSVRLVEGRFDADSYGFVLFFDKDIALAERLENMGLPLFNSSKSIALCDHKGLTYNALNRAGLPQPLTVTAPFTYPNIGYTNFDFIPPVCKVLGYPTVVKAAKGSFGAQVFLANDCAQVKEIIASMPHDEVILQRYIKSSYGKDCRLQVVGGKTVASVMRTSNGDFRANATLGGTMTAFNPPTEFCTLAEQAASALGLTFGGVDLLFDDNDRPLICEVNSNAHFIRLEQATGVDVAGSIADCILGLL